MPKVENIIKEYNAGNAATELISADQSAVETAGGGVVLLYKNNPASAQETMRVLQVVADAGADTSGLLITRNCYWDQALAKWAADSPGVPALKTTVGDTFNEFFWATSFKNDTSVPWSDTENHDVGPSWDSMFKIGRGELAVSPDLTGHTILTWDEADFPDVSTGVAGWKENSLYAANLVRAYGYFRTIGTGAGLTYTRFWGFNFEGIVHDSAEVTITTLSDGAPGALGGATWLVNVHDDDFPPNSDPIQVTTAAPSGTSVRNRIYDQSGQLSPHDVTSRWRWEFILLGF